MSSCNSNDTRCKPPVHKCLTMNWSWEKPMPTQPVVVACNVKVMVSPFTVYVMVYTPSDEDLSPEHESVADVCAVINRCYTILSKVNTCVLYTRPTSAHHSSIHTVGAAPTNSDIKRALLEDGLSSCTLQVFQNGSTALPQNTSLTEVGLLCPQVS